jgi:hypothetical protein
MARECISRCPDIRRIARDVNGSTTVIVGPFYSSATEEGVNTNTSFTDVDRLMLACETSYDCKGPVVQPEVVVRSGLRRRRIVRQSGRIVCGLTNIE